MKHLLPAIAVCLAASGAAVAVGPEDPEPPRQTETSKTCEDGEIWDAKAEACVEAKDSRFNDTQRFRAGRELAFAGRHEAAVAVLMSADDPSDPRILNYLGFSSRMLGQIDAAMAYYKAALAEDPDYLMARSYMGQALLGMGETDLARSELLEIRARGGRDTWAYAALKQALQGKTGY